MCAARDVYKRQLLERGHITTADLSEADAIIVNTCGFIESAKQEAKMCIRDRDKFELMLVNAAGKPLVTSTGFAPDDSVAGEDYLEALASEKGEGHAVYRTAMGEKVMAVTTPVSYTHLVFARDCAAS